MTPQFLSQLLQAHDRFTLFGPLDAAALEREAAAVGSSGPLAGMHVGLKANIACAQAVWSSGLGACRDIRADQDATVVSRLRSAGAILVPGLNMDAAALGGTTENPDFGNTRNPLDPQRSAGGSSGGCAAAIAAGTVDAALGTDTLGSIRLPAAYCGIFGLKPGRGRVPMDGITPLAPSLDTVGPMARSSGTLAEVLKVLTGSPAQDWHVPVSLDGLRVGVPQILAGVGLADEVRAAFATFLQALHAAGVSETQLGLASWQPAALRKAAFLITEVEGAAIFAAALATRGGLSGPVRRLFEYGKAAPAEKVASARSHLAGVKAEVTRSLDQVDVIAMPTTTSLAPLLETGAPVSQADLTCLASVAGLPALAVPVPGPGRLPGSVQLIGRRGSEAFLIALGAALERRGVTFAL